MVRRGPPPRWPRADVPFNLLVPGQAGVRDDRRPRRPGVPAARHRVTHVGRRRHPVGLPGQRARRSPGHGGDPRSLLPAARARAATAAVAQRGLAGSPVVPGQRRPRRATPRPTGTPAARDTTPQAHWRWRNPPYGPPPASAAFHRGRSSSTGACIAMAEAAGDLEPLQSRQPHTVTNTPAEHENTRQSITRAHAVPTPEALSESAKICAQV